MVDKPGGVTSHDIVEAARGWLGIRRVGHLGTLDPQATGVLPLAIRGATKLVPFLQAAEKSYVGTVKMGLTTDTLDGEGKVTSRYEGALPNESEVRKALEDFKGHIEQIPPMYSAVKRDGVPLHRLARQGEQVERDPKSVFIRRIEILSFDLPEFQIDVQCGAGTYVRNPGSRSGAGSGVWGVPVCSTANGECSIRHCRGPSAGGLRGGIQGGPDRGTDGAARAGPGASDAQVGSACDQADREWG